MIRLVVVVVDDEQSAPEAMRRTLHSMRSDWTMEFTSSGKAAFGALAMRWPAWQAEPDSRNAEPVSP
jgi:hypothetical protein